MTIELLMALGFSERAAKEVSDFLGERVIQEEDPTTIKQSKKETPPIVTNGAI
jgi:hypothetical protein